MVREKFYLKNKLILFNLGNSGVTVSQASTSGAITMPSLSRTRQVAPLSRSQQTHLLLPHGLDEGGDDGKLNLHCINK